MCWLGNDAVGLFGCNCCVINISSEIATVFQWCFGSFVVGAGFIDISGGSIETRGGPFNGTVGSFGVLSKGAGARIDVAAIPIATSGQFAEGLRGELGATINTTESGRAHV